MLVGWIFILLAFLMQRLGRKLAQKGRLIVMSLIGMLLIIGVVGFIVLIGLVIFLVMKK